jgi:hypothetical protein
MESDSNDHTDYCDGDDGYTDPSQIRKRLLRDLNLDPEYVPGWGLSEAFREIVQNWYNHRSYYKD